jgi:serine/threonine-protein kinase
MMEAVERVGAVLADRYVVERELGRGGMATVYLARDLKHGRFVAIKVLRPNLAESIGPGRFLREIRIASRLTHPNILPVHDSGNVEGNLFYVMPYVAGESLRDRISRAGRLPLEDAITIAREVAEGLAYAHGQDIIHRDIKPENILLESGHAVIADFGLARAIRAAAVDDLSSARLVLGTPAYMSPEQSIGGDQVDERSDIYSLGCVLYEMLAGSPPFSGPSPQAIAVMHLQQPPPPLFAVRPDVPAPVRAVVDRALAKDPAARFHSAGQFRDALLDQAFTVTKVRTKSGFRPKWAPLLLGGIAAVGWLVGDQPTRSAGLETSTLRLAEAAPSSADPAHLAILYFDDQSPDSALKSIAFGLTEDLIDQLGQIEALSIISANGVRPFRGNPASLDSIAQVLSVGTVVAGTVSGTVDRPSVTVRLIDPTSGRQLDSKLLKPISGDLLALRVELAQEVTNFLRQRLGHEIKLRELRSSTRDDKAWLLLRRVETLREDARTLFTSGDGAAARRNLHMADSLLAMIEKRDPGWVEPIVLRGWLAADQIEMSDTTASIALGRWIPVGLAHSARALTLRPMHPPALELRGTLLFTHWHYSDHSSPDGVVAAERDLRAAAVPENPTEARAWSMLSYLLVSKGSLAEANLAARRAYEADAFLEEAPAVLFRLHLTSLMSKEWAEADDWCMEGHRRFAKDWLFTFCQLSLLSEPGTQPPDVAKAWRLNAELMRLVAPSERGQLGPRWRMMVAAVLARAGQADSAHRVLQRARLDGAADPEIDYYEVRVLLNEREQALSLLERYLRASPTVKAFIRADPTFGPLQNDARFQALVSEKN